MNKRKLLSTILGGVIACTTFGLTARADESNQETKVSFDQAVEIPGQVLPAGSYWFKLVDDLTGRNVVQIFSADWKTLYATEMTVPAERTRLADETTFGFAKRDSSQPEAIVTWFYPGETTGHEFLYPRNEEKELSQDKQEIVTASPLDSTKTGM